ncbi:MAG TPA: spore cortex biosynthesis protein YabQ [Tissierellia bacterium]|nr:spore cortex biosynthesis protein YabQ [Tissierellia bacterium]
MDTSIRVQFYIFLTSVYAGLLIGLAFDLYRVIRYFIKPKRILSGIEDLLFWIVVAIIFFYIINKSNWGELRGFIFFGTFLGGIIYIKVLSRVLHPLMMKLFNGIMFITGWAINMIKIPFVRARKMLVPGVKRIKRIKRVPVDAIREIRRYRKIILKKK